MEKNGKKEVATSGRNIMVIDTNVLIEDYGSISELRKGNNLLVIPLTVIHELDNLKNDPRLGHEVRRVIRIIDDLQESQDPGLIIESGMAFSQLNLERGKPDHQIIATLNYVYQRWIKGQGVYKGYDKVKLITNDFGVKILARSVNKRYDISIEQYKKARAKIQKKDLEIPYFFVSPDRVAKDWSKSCCFPINGLEKKVNDGSAMIGYTSKKNAKKGEFIAVRRGDQLEMIRSNISASGIKPKRSKEGNHPNWEQALALYYTLNQDFDCVFLQGAAGSGKTLIAMAAALELKKKDLYDKVMIFRVPEPVDRKKTLGLLPGDAGAKIGLYLRPIAQSLVKLIGDSDNRRGNTIAELANGRKRRDNEIKEEAPKSSKNSNLLVHVDELFDRYGLEIAVLEFVRGENLDNAFIIVDDAQNLSRHEVKTLITRVGENSKIVFTGDLGQIDSPYLDETTSGLAHAIKKMGTDPRVGIVTLRQTLRSRVATLAEEVL
ncbi:MAG: PhoH family protein [Patescibacteria group bacterium]